MTISLIGTSGQNAIPTFGGFNQSEFNTQKHHQRHEIGNASFVEQEHTHKMYSGRNPLDAPGATKDQTTRFGLNKVYGWREQTLGKVIPAQTETLQAEQTAMRKSGFGGSDASRLSRSLRHGFGQNDPSLQHLLSDQQVSPAVPAKWFSQSVAYLHSDVGVPSAINQNMLDNTTHNTFPHELKGIRRGKHNHTDLAYERKPEVHNFSNVGTGVHSTRGVAGTNMTRGFHASRGPLERPLLLSDLPAPSQPNIEPTQWPGPLEETSNRRAFLVAS